MKTYYNEFDPKAAAWLRVLADDLLIWPGVVDERSIKEVDPTDVMGYGRCHYFAGIGGWDHALELAGWPRGVPVWTGSCPCQPYSNAGKGLGDADERNLWPAFFNLIRQCRPQFVFGEQVSGAIKHGWLDGIRSDLEGAGYACGYAVLGAHSAGTDHIRQRLYWVAYAPSERGCWRQSMGVGGSSEFGGPSQDGTVAIPDTIVHSRFSEEPRSIVGGLSPTDGADLARMGDGNISGRDSRQHGAEAARHGSSIRSDGDFSHYWRDYDLVHFKDGKTRRIEPGTFPLVDGLPRGVVCSGDQSVPINAKASSEGRQVRLKGYGNAIVPQVAAMFIRSFMDYLDVKA